MKATRIMVVATLIPIVFLLVSCAPAKKRKTARVDATSTVRRVEDKAMIARTVSHENKTIPGNTAIGHDTEVTLLRNLSADSVLSLIIRNKMDKYDREQLNHVYERGVSGQISSWTNPEQGNQYRVAPRPAYQGAGKRVCREAEIKAMLGVDGGIKRMSTTACRNLNGQWRIGQER